MSSQHLLNTLQRACDAHILTEGEAVAVVTLPAPRRTLAIDALALVLDLPAALSAGAIVDQVDRWLAAGADGGAA